MRITALLWLLLTGIQGIFVVISFALNHSLEGAVFLIAMLNCLRAYDDALGRGL